MAVIVFDRPGPPALSQAGAPDTADALAPAPRAAMLERIQLSRSTAGAQPGRADSAPSTRARPARGAAPERVEPAWLTACGSPTEAQPQDDPDVNGLIPDDELCELPTSSLHLQRDAAAAWWRLSTRYQEDLGEPMCMTDAYRDLASQEQLYATKPGLAATPGTSNHGWGIALDLCGGAESFGTPESAWLAENGPRLGWVLPAWARSTGSRPEPWHWEFAD